MALVDLENKKQIIILMAALGIGIFAAAAVGNFVTMSIKEETTRLAIQYEKAQELKDQQHTAEMDTLKQQIVAMDENIKKAVEDAARAAAAAERAKKPVVEDKGPKRKNSLALRTPTGKRAITVKIDSLGAVGGLVNPGDFVDVIARLTLPPVTKKGKEIKTTVTTMLFQGLQILAINTNLDDAGLYDDQQKDALRITVAVDPQEAGLLSFADQNGRLELALRSPNEKGRQMLSTATWSALADYVLENNGADIEASSEKGDSGDSDKSGTPKQQFQIYRAGKEH
ncbi:MAG: Flp pilus assembly protein CpaB [Candidatus Omnitrophica bacterium]|nr:Flp pilus assembly protein CpaB [Candidatus Omnitrophota bacterium]